MKNKPDVRYLGLFSFLISYFGDDICIRILHFLYITVCNFTRVLQISLPGSGGKLTELKTVGVQKVFGEHDSISSSQSPYKTLSHQIQFPPVASLSTASDKCEFDMTLSKSDVMKMQRISVCLCVCINRGA